MRQRTRTAIDKSGGFGGHPPNRMQATLARRATRCDRARQPHLTGWGPAPRTPRVLNDHLPKQSASRFTGSSWSVG